MSPYGIGRALGERVAGAVRTDDASLEKAARDAGIFRVRPLAVVEPRDEEDVRAVLELAAAERIPVTPRGGGTNTGGAAVGEGIVLELRPSSPLGRVVGLSAVDGMPVVRAQAGASGSWV